jgi:uncharacterized membrane protein YjfL (UPF0719 family)
MEDFIQWKYVVSALVFSGIGVGVFALCYAIVDFLTPRVNLWVELTEKKNVALAIFMGSVMIGIAIIIGSAIHG